MFSRTVTAGMDVKPWRIAGPEYINLTGRLDERSYFENPEVSVGDDITETAMADCIRDVQNPDDAAQKKWTILDTPELYHGFGKYFMTNHLGIIKANSRIYSEEAQTMKVRLSTRLSDRICLLVNGEVQINNSQLCERHKKGGVCEEAQIRLKAGENEMDLIVMRIARMVEIGWRLEVIEAEKPVTVHVPVDMDLELRELIERSVARTHMKADTYAQGELVRYEIGTCDDSRIRIATAIENAEGKTVDTMTPEAGTYTVKVSWSVEGQEIVCKEFPITVCRVLEPLPGYDRFRERQRIFLEKCAELDPEKNARDCADILWARYALGQYDRISYGMVDLACSSVDHRDDCADFILLPLLRIVHAEQKDPKLSSRLTERIRHAALGFKYWVDEANDCMMWFDSENHRFGFHTLEYLAGLLFPQDIFTNSGQNGLFHSMKGRMHLMEWLSQRIRFGFNEFHSDSYLPVTMGPLLAIQEMAPYEEFSLRTMAQELTHIMVFHLAANNFNGAIAGPRGRSYNLPMRNPLQQGTTSILYLLFGRDRAGMKLTPGAMAMAIDSYVPPKGIYEVAYDYEEMENHYKSGLYHEGKQNADITAFRTPQYMVSSVRNHNVGACEAHLHVAQITLPKDMILFFSAPFTRQEGSGLRPDYWAGQAWTPEVYQYRNTLGIRWKEVQEPFIWMTHCYFEAEKLDELRQYDHWTFGRIGDSYVGIWSKNPHVLAEEGNYAHRELISEGRNNCWVAECGCRSENGDFDSFVNALLKAPVTAEGEEFVFESPKNGRIGFGNDFTVNGKMIPVGDMAVDSRYMSSRYGSGVYDFHFNGWDERIWSYASAI